MRDTKDASRSSWRRAAGWLWLITWLLLLSVIVSPWRQLGGLVSERLRWLECYALPLPLIIGCSVGRLGRGRRHVWLLRRLLLPPAAMTAAALVVMRCMEWHDPIGVAFTAFMAYWAGLDIAFGAYPLMEGEPVRKRDLPPWLGG